jgi:glycosyltransferase involved in cell wall biosynthesis
MTSICEEHLTSRPLVSIGLPVFNGANYLKQAAAGILEQTYRNIELIISDNASTDETSAICRDLAARDSRVRVYRNETNIGAAGNYNQTFRLAKGEYFKWAAHDDVLAPTFVERAVQILESDASVVLCNSRTGRINENDTVTGAYPSDALWDDPSASRRFESLVFTRHACVIVFGLIRHAALTGTPLIAPYVTSDRVLLAELGLRGRIREIPEDLFFRRDHPGSSLRAFPDHRERIVWFDPTRSASLSFPEWNEVFGYASATWRARIGIRERIRCWRVVTKLALTRWRPLLADFKYAALGLVTRRSS